MNRKLDTIPENQQSPSSSSHCDILTSNNNHNNIDQSPSFWQQNSVQEEKMSVDELYRSGSEDQNNNLKGKINSNTYNPTKLIGEYTPKMFQQQQQQFSQSSSSMNSQQWHDERSSIDANSNVYAQENEKLRNKLQELNDQQQRKRVASLAKDQGLSDNVMDCYKALSVNYNQAQQRMLELETMEHQKSEQINTQKVKIQELETLVKARLDQLGMQEFITEIAAQAKSNELDLFTEIAHLKIKLDSDKAEREEHEMHLNEWREAECVYREEIAELKLQNQASVELTEQLNSELRDSADCIAQLKSEKDLLAVDKEALLDYIEDLKGKIEEQESKDTQSQDSIRQLNQRIEELQDKSAGLENNIVLLQSDKKQSEEQQRQLAEEIAINAKKEAQEKEEIKEKLRKTQSELESAQAQLAKETSIATMNEKQLQQRETTLMTTIKNLEDLILTLNRNKQTATQVNARLKEFVNNKEIVNLIEETSHIQSEQLAIEREKNTVAVQIQQLEARRKCSPLRNSNGNEDQQQLKNDIKKIDQLKEAIGEYESNQQILQAKLQSLETELDTMLENHKAKLARMNQLERINQHLKNDLSILKTDIDMKEISRKNIESAYNILLTDYKRVTQDNNNSNTNTNNSLMMNKRITQPNHSRGKDSIHINNPASLSSTPSNVNNLTKRSSNNNNNTASNQPTTRGHSNSTLNNYNNTSTSHSNIYSQGNSNSSQQQLQFQQYSISPSESYRKNNSISTPYNVYENYEENFGMAATHSKLLSTKSSVVLQQNNRNMYLD